MKCNKIVGVTNNTQVPLAEIQGATTHGERWVGDNVFPGAPLSPAPQLPKERRQVQYTRTNRLCYSPKRFLSHTGEATHISLQFIILTGQALKTQCSCLRSPDIKHDQILVPQQLVVLRCQRCKTGIKSRWLAATMNKHIVHYIACVHSIVILVLKDTEQQRLILKYKGHIIVTSIAFNLGDCNLNKPTTWISSI